MDEKTKDIRLAADQEKKLHPRCKCARFSFLPRINDEGEFVGGEFEGFNWDCSHYHFACKGLAVDVKECPEWAGKEWPFEEEV